ncbi:hypothetical protein CTI12_AA386920 [Artemisia annua]|uniref:BZIP domain-containing protein n=1 Tax=Artemisia annua TaxID=35608 RepID=A0A2U1ME31_ARTAN|nr:hypothetical protein CTI12_AA386920 [Artemisia annua]
MSYKNFGSQPAEVGSGNGRPPGGPGGFHLARQGSIYSLTFDELQNTMGSIGKDFGSMNMDELLKSIWNAEEVQTTGPNTGNGAQEGGVVDGGANIQRQGSLTLPRTLSQKTVDDVWREISKEYTGFGEPNLPQRQQTLGEMTLEEFLVKAGVVREEAELANKPNDNGLFSNLTNNQNPPVTVSVGSPAVSSDGMGKNNGDTSSVSPSPYEFSGVVRGRKSGTVEKVVERRQRRMIKNRESAARSRARKQAYTMELEAEVSKLKEQNQELKRKAEMMEMQQNQVMEMMNTQPGAKQRCLRKTHSGPW